MFKSLFLCLLLVNLVPIAPVQLVRAANLSQVTEPSRAYFQLANEIASLFQQLEKLPTTQGAALLRQKAPALQARIKKARPAYQRYLKSLSAQELQLENKRVVTSKWGNYFAKWEAAGLATKPGLRALLKPGSPSGQMMLDLMNIFDGI